MYRLKCFGGRQPKVFSKGDSDIRSCTLRLNNQVYLVTYFLTPKTGHEIIASN